MKRLTFADVPADALAGKYRTFVKGDLYHEVVDIWRDPRSGIAITVVVDGPTGRTWLANPECEGKP